MHRMWNLCQCLSLRSHLHGAGEISSSQKKEEKTTERLNKLAASKVKQEAMAAAIGRGTADPVVKQFAAALERSNRLMAEDLYREAGYMLPQSRNTHELLMSMVSDDDKLPEDFPKEAARRLLDLLEVNE